MLSMSLSPCCPYFPAEVFRRFSPCDAPCCLRLKSASSAFGAWIFEVTMGSLTLRPGASLTTHKMALSIGFRIFSFLPSCYSSYGALNFYPGGTDSHCSCQPLWTHALSAPTTCRFKPGPLRVARDPAGALLLSSTQPQRGAERALSVGYPTRVWSRNPREAVPDPVHARITCTAGKLIVRKVATRGRQKHFGIRY